MFGASNTSKPSKGNASRRNSSKNVKSTPACDICHRPGGLYKCEDCGAVNNGRVKISCPSHPRVFYVMDFDKCPKCKSGNIKDVVVEDRYVPINVSPVNQESNASCICDRGKVVVFCQYCGWFGFGRARQICTAHPKNFFLSDLVICPECKLETLEED